MSEQEGPTSKRRWRNYVIYPRFQLSLIAFNVVILFSALGIVYYQVNKSFWVLGTYARTLELKARNDYFRIIDFHVELIEDALITAIIICTILIFIYNLLFTHKSAGAVHRLKTYFQGIIENGHKYDLSFRDGDMHSDIPKIVNEAIDRIKSDAKGDQE